jgi:hypothetical protein
LRPAPCQIHDRPFPILKHINYTDMKFKFLAFAGFVLLCAVVLVHCKKEKTGEDNRLPFFKSIDPKTQISELSKNLIIHDGTNQLGAVPATNIANNLQIAIGQASASITNDNLLFIPFLFTSSIPVTGMYLQLKGADNYWQVPLSNPSGNVYVAGIGIPPRVLNGNFEISYKLYDAAGKVGNEKKMAVTIVSTQSFCGTQNRVPRVEGQDGLTVRTFDMGNTKGKVKIVYDTYTVKDRIDIRYNGQWIKSTGTLLNSNSAPPIKPCNQVGNNDGFVGQTGSFEFEYDPAISHKVDVYVSGCLDGGTLWYFDAYCPDGSMVSKPNWYDSVPDCPCDYATAAKLGETTNPDGKWKDYGGADPWYSLHDFHYGATSEVRWLPKVKGGHGQQCTYDDKGKLITGGIAAGSPDKVSPDGAFGLPGGHWDADMEPWWTKSCTEYLAGWPSNNDNACAGNVVSGISHIKEMIGSNITCKEVVDLLKAANQASLTSISQNLKDFLLGIKPNVYPTKAKLLEDLKLWNVKDGCTILGPNNFCNILKKAIANLGG